jgi:hypothetical protein
MAAQGKDPHKSVPKMLKPGPQMEQFSALLATEILTWPNTSTKVMFGMTALYRGTVMFGAVPKTKTLWTKNSVMFKLTKPPDTCIHNLEDARIISGGKTDKWYGFEMTEPEDLRDALNWFGIAYDHAIKGKAGSATKRGKRPPRR